MRKITLTLMIASLTVTCFGSHIQAQMAEKEEALTVANNWIRLIIHNKGNWGGSQTAEVEEIQEFKRGDKIIGHFFQVKPKGHIIVSLRRELSPVKAYSATSDLDPESDEGLVDLIKGGMESILNRIENEFGPLNSVRAEDLEKILEIDYRQSWDELERDNLDLEMNYQAGDILLTSSWHQNNPYNRECPAPPEDDDCNQLRCLVGCVATAGAQIMRYWNWPPRGMGSPYDDSYDWPNMPDILTTSSPLAELNAVAELCHEVGIAVDMNYCAGDDCGSSASTDDMEGVYKDKYRYSANCTKKNRNDYTSAVDWFDLLKNQFNVNRPVQYRVENHSIVGDGWQETGDTPIREFHMNYGWANNNTTWYTINALLYGGRDEEYVLIKIYPNVALGSWLSGLYDPPTSSFPYRYFDQDATGHDAQFDAGQYLHFLPGITVTCTSTTGGKIEFRGWSTGYSHLYTRGEVASRGINIYSGHVYLYQNGSIKFH